MLVDNISFLSSEELELLFRFSTPDKEDCRILVSTSDTGLFSDINNLFAQDSHISIDKARHDSYSLDISG